MTSSTKREMNEALRRRLLQDRLVQEAICRRAYEIFQHRGGHHGHDREDWLQAENEILDELTETDLRSTPDFLPEDFSASQVQHLMPGYKPSAEKPRTPAAGQLSDGPVPETAKTAPTSPADTRPSRKKHEKAKSTSNRKHKKDANPVDGAANLIAESKTKKSKSAPKLKAGKKKEKKT